MVNLNVSDGVANPVRLGSICEWNCGGTACDAPIKYVTFSGPELDICEHKNGWYITVKFWIFKKRMFVCSDCGEPIAAPMKIKQKIRTIHQHGDLI